MLDVDILEYLILNKDQLQIMNFNSNPNFYFKQE
jgi:hypothetical protein